MSRGSPGSYLRKSFRKTCCNCFIDHFCSIPTKMLSFTQLTELAEMLTNRRDAWTRREVSSCRGDLVSLLIDPEAPDIDAVHAAAMLIACAWPGSQLEAVDAIRRFWNLSAVRDQHDRPRSDLRFGPQVTAMINLVADSRRSDDRDILANVQSVTIRRDITLAAINYLGFTRFFGDLDSAARDNARLATLTVIAPSVIKRLGQFVARSRVEAACRGITIDVAGAYQALGDEPATSRGARIRVTDQPNTMVARAVHHRKAPLRTSLRTQKLARSRCVEHTASRIHISDDFREVEARPTTLKPLRNPRTMLSDSNF